MEPSSKTGIRGVMGLGTHFGTLWFQLGMYALLNNMAVGIGLLMWQFLEYEHITDQRILTMRFISILGGPKAKFKFLILEIKIHPENSLNFTNEFHTFKLKTIREFDMIFRPVNSKEVLSKTWGCFLGWVGGIHEFFQSHSKCLYKRPNDRMNHPEWLYWSCMTCLRHIRNHPTTVISNG